MDIIPRDPKDFFNQFRDIHCSFVSRFFSDSCKCALPMTGEKRLGNPG